MINCISIVCIINRAFEMYVKSIKMALEVTSILCQIMPFMWVNLVPFFGLDPNSEVNPITSSLFYKKHSSSGG
jgi:hypothetical protein